MHTIKYLSLQFGIYSFLAALTILSIIPVTVFAASSSSTTSSGSSAAIDSSSLSTDSGDKSSITGTSTDSVKKVQVVITASSSNKALFKSSRTTVKHNTWSARTKKALDDGTYTVSVYNVTKGSKLLSTGTLSVGLPPAVLKISSIPLLGGGVAAAGTVVPISYLQVTNTGTETTSVNGFWVRQDGLASTASVIGLSSVDDRGLNRTQSGGTEGTVVFTNGMGYVPSTAVLAPGERRLFTLKAHLSATSGRYAGTALMLNVTGIDAQATITAAFPILGTTWVLSA